MKRKYSKSGLRIIAVFEAAKGALILAAGFGLLAFVHKDLPLAAEQLVRHMHINPARHYPRIFIDAANRVNETQLWVMALSALAYSTVRFIEAYGLWKARQWAEWFALLTAGLYLPLELYEVILKATWPKIIIFAVNLCIVSYMCYVLYRGEPANTKA